MKKHLQWLAYSLLFCALFATKAQAQITYSENFDDDDHGWALYSFSENDVVPCEGAGGIRVNIWELNDYADMLSPSLGTADGSPVILTYQYKLLQYDSEEPTEPVLNEDDWGVIGVFYSTSPTGPFIQIDEINTDNHTESASCETRTVVFTPPAGSQVYVGIAAQLGTWYNDYFVFIDDVNIVPAPGCTGTPDASAAIASSTVACNTQEISLTLSPAYDVAGLDFQWQTSANGVDFTDVATGGDSAIYTVVQTETTWYRAVVSCSAGGDEVISEPVMVTSTGLPCYCDVIFDEDVEPITYVNFAGIDNQTSAIVNGTPGVENFTSLAPAEVTIGQTYTITLEGNTNGNYETPFTVYIDFNHNGVLDDEGEVFLAGSVEDSDGEDGQQAVTEITIPATAMEGLTYMRVLKLFNEYSTDPCSSEDGIGYGQAEDYLINISPCTTEAPTADADQYFCMSASVADLLAGEGTGEETILWYAAATGGEPLAAGTSLVNETTYYASVMPYGGCESQERTAVTAHIATVESATLLVTQPTCLESTGTIQITAPLGAQYEYSIDGENYQASPLFEDVLSGTYPVYVSVDGCASVAIDVIIELAPETPATPTVTVTQPTCANPTGTIQVTSPLGVDMTYTLGTNYQASPMFGGLAPGTYMVTAQNTSGCISESIEVVINPLEELAAPTADAEQTVCNGSELEELMVDGVNVVWYADETGGEPLDIETMLTDGTTYYAASVEGECESERTAVTVTLNVVPAPTGEVIQVFNGPATLTFEDIEITADGELNWYASEEDAMNSDNDLDNDYEITESQTLYVTQEIDGCESEPFAVTVDIVLGAEEFATGSFTYHPNPVNDVLNLAYTSTIESVEVYNLIGQKVIEKQGNQNEMMVNMSELSAGTYLVKVISGGASKTIKVVKQ